MRTIPYDNSQLWVANWGQALQTGAVDLPQTRKKPPTRWSPNGSWFRFAISPANYIIQLVGLYLPLLDYSQLVITCHNYQFVIPVVTTSYRWSYIYHW